MQIWNSPSVLSSQLSAEGETCDNKNSFSRTSLTHVIATCRYKLDYCAKTKLNYWFMQIITVTAQFAIIHTSSHSVNMQTFLFNSRKLLETLIVANVQVHVSFRKFCESVGGCKTADFLFPLSRTSLRRRNSLNRNFLDHPRFEMHQRVARYVSMLRNERV